MGQGAKSYEIIISRDLFFNENDMPGLKEASNESTEFAKDQDIQLQVEAENTIPKLKEENTEIHLQPYLEYSKLKMKKCIKK